MDNVWHYLGLCVAAELLGVCSGYPVPPSEGFGGQDGIGWWSLLLSTACLVSSVLLVVGCLCCRRTKGFQEFTDATSVQGYVNDAAATEFTIFPPLPPLSAQTAANQAVRFEPLPDIRPTYAKRPAAFNNAVSHGLNAHDWFADGAVNFPRHQLQYVRELGRGWFGRAVEGTAQQLTDGSTSTACVVKILHEDASPTDQMYFLHELRPYRDLDHPNVLKMLGRCLETDPFLVLLEACPSGDLKSFLCQNIATAGALCEQGVTLNMASNIAAGLHHMLDNGFVHTDLAARNCLVTPTLGAKIGDYGGSVDAFKEDYYLAGDVALPVRWCAPETLRCTATTIETRQVTAAANVWSYGVVLWELGEFARLPYGDLTDDEVVGMVVGEGTRRLGRPTLAGPHGDSLYLLMQQCWGPAASRPAMPQIMSMLAHLQRHPATAAAGSPQAAEDFERRWDTFKPNTIVVTDNHSAVQVPSECEVGIPPTSPQPSTASSCDLFKDNKVKSDSLQNLRGSLDDLSGQWEKTARKHSEGSIPASLGPDFDSWLKGGASGETDDEDARFVQKISAAIQDLDDALALEVTSSSSDEDEASKEHTPVRQNAVLDFRLGRQDKEKDSGSSDDTEEEMWRGRIERGEFSAKVKAKSKSVADLMVLTHIEPSDNSDSEPPSLTWSFERRTSNNNSFTRPRKTSLVPFGSESDVHNSILGEDFLESLHQIQVARRDRNGLSLNYQADGQAEAIDDQAARLESNRSFIEREQSANYQPTTLDTNRNVDVSESQLSTGNAAAVEPVGENQIKAGSFLAIDASGKEPGEGSEIQDSDVSEAGGRLEGSGDRVVSKIAVDNIVPGEGNVLAQSANLSNEKPSIVTESLVENHELNGVEAFVQSEVVVQDPCIRVDEVTQKEGSVFIESELPAVNDAASDGMPKKGTIVLSDTLLTNGKDDTDEMAGLVESREILHNKVPVILVSQPSPRMSRTPVESPRKPVPLPRRMLRLVSNDSSDEDLDSESIVESLSDRNSSEDIQQKSSEDILQTVFATEKSNEEAPLEMVVDVITPLNEHVDHIVSPDKVVDSSKPMRGIVESFIDLEKGFDVSLSNVTPIKSSPDSSHSCSEDEEQSFKLNFTSSTPNKPRVVPRQLTAVVPISQSENNNKNVQHPAADVTYVVSANDVSTNQNGPVDNSSNKNTESSVVLGPCEDYTLDYFKGLKTAYHEKGESEIDYSINGWDTFLDETLETHKYDDVSFISPSADVQFIESPQLNSFIGALVEKPRDSIMVVDEDKVLDNQEAVKVSNEVHVISQGFQAVDARGDLELSNSTQMTVAEDTVENVDLSGCAMNSDAKLSSGSFHATDSCLPEDVLKLVDLETSTSVLNNSFGDDFGNKTTENLILESANEPVKCAVSNNLVDDIAVTEISSRIPAVLFVDDTSKDKIYPDEMFSLEEKKQVNEQCKKDGDTIIGEVLDLSKCSPMNSIGSDFEDVLCNPVLAGKLPGDLEESMNVALVAADVINNESAFREFKNVSVKDLDQLDELKHNSSLLQNLEETLKCKSKDVLITDLNDALNIQPTMLQKTSDETGDRKSNGNVVEDLFISGESEKIGLQDDLCGKKELESDELTNIVNNLLPLVELKDKTVHLSQDLFDLDKKSVSLVEDESKATTERNVLPQSVETKGETLDAIVENVSTRETYLPAEPPVSVEADFKHSDFHINVLSSGDDLDDAEGEECDDEFSLDVKHSTPDDERSSDSGFRDNKGSLSESCEDACDEKYNLEDIEAELEETFNRGGFNHHEENSMVFGEECSSNSHCEDVYNVKDIASGSAGGVTPDEYSTNISKEYSVQDDFYDTRSVNVVPVKEKHDTIVGGTVEKTVDKSLIEDKTDRSDNVTSVKQSGWYLHPPSEAEDYPDPKSSSYVSFSLDEEFVTAIRNELIDKLPLANENADRLLQANRNADDVMDMDEDDLEERQDIMIHYNVYQSPLSPILEEPEGLATFDWPSERRGSFDWPAAEEGSNERFEADIREALEGCSMESSGSSDKDPNNSVVLEDLENVSKAIRVKSTATDLEDDILVVDTETNEARLVESPKPKPHLAFVSTKAVVDLVDSFTPDSISPSTTSSGASEFLTPSEVSPLHHLLPNNEAADIVADLVDMFDRDSSYEDCARSYESSDLSPVDRIDRDSSYEGCARSYESSDLSPVDRLDFLTANPTRPHDLSPHDDLDRTLQLNDLGELLKLASLDACTEAKSPVSPETNLAAKDVIRRFVNTSELLRGGGDDEMSMLAFSAPKGSTLDEITFSGPGVDDVGEMSTSFSGQADEEEEDDEYAPDWESDSEENSSSSGEFIWQAYECVSSYPMESIAEEDEDDDDDSSTCSSSSGSGAEFIPSAWNSQSVPVKSALRSPEKMPEWKKNVTFKKQKYHCVYEYPRDTSEDIEAESASWRPNLSPANESPAAAEYSSYSTNGAPAAASYAGYSTNGAPEVDYASYADWELMEGDEVEADTESESENAAKTARPNKFDFYKLGGEDYDFSGALEDGEFFISSSARPFQPHDSLASSQFFPGGQSEDESDPASPLSPTGLGELRHTRDRLKLNLSDAPVVATATAGKKGRSLSEATLLDSDAEDSGIESSNGTTAQLTLKSALDTGEAVG